MNARITDVIIHTRAALDSRQFHDLATLVYRQQGVVSLSRNPHTPRHLMVVYNAACITARRILQTVTGQGHPASLIGM